MDGLTTMLGTHRGSDVFVLRCEMEPPWGVLIADEATLSVIVMIRGECVLTRKGAESLSLTAGDVLLAKGSAPFILSDAPGREPTIAVTPDQLCRPIDGVPAPERPIRRLGTRTWGNAPGGSCVYLTGVYELPAQVSGRLVAALPDVAHLPAPQGNPRIMALLADEVAADLPGQDVILDRCVDLMVVSALREWFARPDAVAPQWWLAQQDPVIGPVLAAIHDRYAEPWTLERLAGLVGYSRASVARRFTELVGQPPMTYLTEWRIQVACDLLTTTNRTVESVASAVGYGNAFAFSTAVKRHRGVSPRDIRAAARPGRALS